MCNEGISNVDMKFKLSTLILVGIALALGGGVYFWERQGGPTQSEKTAAQPIFTFQEDQVQAFTIKTRQQTLSFVRTGDKAKTAWLMKAPTQATASDASVAYLLNLLATARSDRSLTVPASQRRDFGLAQPLATVDVKLNNQEMHQLVLGHPNFNQSSLYAQVDPPATSESLKVLLVPTAFEDAVNRPLAEWKSNGRRPSTDPN